MLKHFKFSLLFLAAAFLSPACGDVKDDIGVEFPVTFRATFGNEDIVKGQEYFLGNLPLFFVKLPHVRLGHYLAARA
jgi:hypothetical protein